MLMIKTKNSRYRLWVRISLILVFLVIIAGAMVRMTGSGMGCPDWPKCFGYYIPPTEASELEWQPFRTFKKGQVIIQNETLQVAASSFTTSENYDQTNWNPYTKHDYAKFNVWHTWIEYINRLMGALSGIAILIMAIFSFGLWKDHKQITVLSWISVVLLGFQAWLGATVVYSVLAPVKITIHMVMALVIVALLLYLMYIASGKRHIGQTPGSFKGLLLIALICTLIQIVLGTQVRQFVDEQVSFYGYEAKESWLSSPELSFYFHRTFSVLVLALNLYLWYYNKKHKHGLSKLNWVLWLVLAEAVTGIAMYYFEFPLLSQPLHMVIASGLFAFQFYVVLEVFLENRASKSAI
jgi:cytochrome c oxidase assembly protein subunit 15